MKISYFPNQTALQSEPVWRAFLAGCTSLGFQTVENSYDADAAVIWSVLWQGRMRANQQVYEHYRKQGKPVFVIEVGSLKRGKTWKISLNNINRLARWGNEKNLDLGRSSALGLSLQDFRQIRAKKILIATQHEFSLQWKGQPSMTQWVKQTVEQIRQCSDLPIVLRPHPRYVFSVRDLGVELQRPAKILNTYDEYDLNFDYHCVINFNSGVAAKAAIAGTPVICDTTSLAYPVSMTYEQLSNPVLADREEWFLKLCHTEWLVEEIAQGTPIKRLLD